jgi:hypothetical protein
MFSVFKRLTRLIFIERKYGLSDDRLRVLADLGILFSTKFRNREKNQFVLK